MEKYKAYEKTDFLHSSDARMIRILSEYLEPAARFKKFNILDTIVFFGSARLRSKKDALKEYNKIKASEPKTTPNFVQKLRTAQQHVDMSKYYEDAVSLSKKITTCLLYTSPSPRDS